MEVQPTAERGTKTPAPPPGTVICMNDGLAKAASAIKPQPNVVVVVVYGDAVYGRQQALPDDSRGPIWVDLFLDVLKKRYPDRVIYLAVFDMPKIA